MSVGPKVAKSNCMEQGLYIISNKDRFPDKNKFNDQ